MIIRYWDVTLANGEGFTVRGKNISEARRNARWYLNVQRLPKGTKIVHAFLEEVL